MFRVEIDIITGEKTVIGQSLYEGPDGELIAVDEGTEAPEGFTKVVPTQEKE